MLLELRLQRGDADGAAALARERVAAFPGSETDAWAAALSLSRCLELRSPDSPPARADAGQAVEWLRASVGSGARTLRDLRREPELRALRARREGRRLLEELER